MNTQKIEQKTTKIFRISGYVQVAVSAYIRAKNLKEAEKFFKQEEGKYGSGNGGNWNYIEGNWVSKVTFDEPIKEFEDQPVTLSGQRASEIASIAKIDKKAE